MRHSVLSYVNTRHPRLISTGAIELMKTKPGLIDRDVVEEAALAVRRAVEPDALHQAGVLAPQLAELIVWHGDEKILESHRREIVVVFCRVTRLLQLHAPKGPLSHARLPGQEASRTADRSPDTLRWLYDFDPAAVPSAP